MSPLDNGPLSSDFQDVTFNRCLYMQAVSAIRKQKCENGTAIIGAAYAIRLLRGLSSGWLGPLIPTIAVVQAISLVNVALMFSVYFCGLFTMLIGGPLLLNRFGGKDCLLIATMCYASGFLTIAFSTGELMLWAGSLFIGFGAGLSIPCGTLCVLRLSESNPGSALSKYAILYGVGALLGPICAYATMSSPWSYRTVYLLGFVGALLIGLLLYRIKSTSLIKDGSDRSEIKRLLKEPQLWFFAVLLFLYIGVESSACAWMYVYLRQSLELDKSFASLGITALYIGLTVGRIVAIDLCKRFSNIQIIVGSLTLAAISFVLLLAGPEIPLVALAIVFTLGIGFGPVFPNIIASGASKFPQGISAVTSALMICGVPGGMLFPWLGGIIGQNNGMHGTLFLLLTLIGVMLVMIFAGSRLSKRSLGRGAA